MTTNSAGVANGELDQRSFGSLIHVVTVVKRSVLATIESLRREQLWLRRHHRTDHCYLTRQNAASVRAIVATP
jgi:hypothetical protein